MKELLLRGSQTSHIYLEKGLLARAGEICLKGYEDVKPLDQARLKVCVIADTNTAPLYLDTVRDSFSGRNVEIVPHIIQAGEAHKTLGTVSLIYDTLCLHGFRRNDMILALGGGVVGDIAGFAAATYLRGIRYLVQIPTTLLAQVDSSVGGKCGVDLSHGKNLVGAFRQPDRVIIDCEVLKTLSKEVYASGMAEVIKYGCIMEPDILNRVSADEGDMDIEAIIETCVQIKVKVVEEDEHEENLRRILNFGHTIGHGVEQLGQYTAFSHGEAVAMGMVAALRIGEGAGITKKGSAAHLIGLLEKYDLPTALPYPAKEIFQALLADKKKEGEGIHFIYMEDFGRVQVRKTPLKELSQMLEEIGEV